MARVCSALSALFFLVTGAEAQGAMPSASEIVQRVQGMVPAPVAFVVNYVEIADEGPPTIALRVSSDGQGRARVETQFLRESRSEVAFYAPGALAPARSVESAPSWLQWWMGRPLSEILKARGVDTTLRSLSHVAGEIVWVVGALQNQADVAQLHLQRNNGRLRRAVDVEGSGDSARVSPVALDNYLIRDGSPTPFPGRLTLRVGTKDVTLKNTWLRVGEEARISPEEFTPAVRR